MSAGMSLHVTRPFVSVVIEATLVFFYLMSSQ
jgi:hypothetical protein